MNKHLEVENPQNQYYQRIFQLSNPLLLGEIILDKGRIIPDKEELVFDRERELSLPKKRRFFRRKKRGFSKPPSINQEDLHDER